MNWLNIVISLACTLYIIKLERQGLLSTREILYFFCSSFLDPVQETYVVHPCPDVSRANNF